MNATEGSTFFAIEVLLNKKKIDTCFAQHMLDNRNFIIIRKTESMDFLTILYYLDECASNSSEPTLKLYPSLASFVRKRSRISSLIH